MCERADQGGELFRVEGGVWGNIESIGQGGGARGRGKTLQGEFGEIVLWMALNGCQSLVEGQQETNTIDGESGLRNLRLQIRDQG